MILKENRQKKQYCCTPPSVCGLYVLRFCGQIFKYHFYSFFQHVPKDCFWLFPTQVLSILCYLWNVAVMNTERGTTQPSPILTKWGFKKASPGGWPLLGLCWSCHKASGDKLVSSGHVPEDSLLEISPQLSDDKMSFFPLWMQMLCHFKLALLGK